MNVRDEIMALEAELREAELRPEPAFFERALADDAVLDGELAKAKIVAAHRAGGGVKFISVEMSEYEVREHGAAAVVTCAGVYRTPTAVHELEFMRVWLKKPEGWRIIAGSVTARKPA